MGEGYSYELGVLQDNVDKSILFFGVFFLITTFYWVFKIGSKRNKTTKEQGEIIRIVWVFFFAILWGVYTALWYVNIIGFESTR